MRSIERVLTALSHKEPDRVPLFLLLSMYGAKEMGIGIKEYFANKNNVVKAQLHMRKKYRTDCLNSFYYAAVEVEASGGEVIFYDDGPPNSGEPIIKRSSDILAFEPPKINDSPCLLRVLETIDGLKKESNGDTPIIGVVMSPFSLPVMQMGFERYLELMFENPEMLDVLMKKNEEFCVAWANAQLKAGAAAICYFDPVSSSSIVPHETFMGTGNPIAIRTLKRINGAAAIHMASGRVLPIIDQIIETGAAVVGVSSKEDICEIKERCAGKISILGNLCGINMCSWTTEEAANAVKDLIEKAAYGGGLIVSDSHGEIPYQVEEKVLLAIAESVEEYGYYGKSNGKHSEQTIMR